MNTINWRDLIVTSEGEELGTLGTLAADPEGLPGSIKLGRDGSIIEWQDYLISAPGEEPAWDTPNQPVDWDGFRAIVMD